VASEDVVLVGDPAELRRVCADIWQRKPGTALVAEEFLTGELHSLETIGDGGTPSVLGGFHTTLSPPPYFIERSMVFEPSPPPARVCAVLAQLAALGVGFGACHTEYVVDGDRVRLVEANYRAIGDQCDLLLADVTGVPLFEYVLRVHLGEPLPTMLPRGHSGRARVDWPCADVGGTLVTAPSSIDKYQDGIRLSYRPLREIGTRRPKTNTNRDYLGALRTIGPAPSDVDSAAAAFLAAHSWDIQP
jgi:biotin carboxylase